MTESQDVRKKRNLTIAVLRAVSLCAGVYQLIFGERAIGAVILLSVMAISLPGILTRGRVTTVPLQIELILFIMVVLQFVIGETLNFYDNVPYFDKFVHFTIPFFLGYISFLIAYTMQVTGNLRMTPRAMVVVVVLVALGLGAAWEIGEYLCDVFLGSHLQGSLTASPLVDTMNDLIADTVGGVFGALLGLRYMRRKNGKEYPSFSKTAGELADDYSKITHH